MNDTILEGVRVKIYEPVSTIRSEERSVLFFMHGGGWSTLSIGQYVYFLLLWKSFHPRVKRIDRREIKKKKTPIVSKTNLKRV